MILFKDELKVILQSKISSNEKNKERSKSTFKKAPKVKPISLTNGTLIFIGISWIGVFISAAIATYVFFGIATLLGLIALAEGNAYIKHLIVKSNRLIDISIFMLTIYSTLALGVTITASLTFAGLGYSLVYAPWLRLRNKL